MYKLNTYILEVSSFDFDVFLYVAFNEASFLEKPSEDIDSGK